VRRLAYEAADSGLLSPELGVSRALNLPEVLREGSTDSNVPMNLGIPAITISGGGNGSGAHALGETPDTTDSWRGSERAVLLVAALAR
jgi:tripeptide aminopeptidase